MIEPLVLARMKQPRQGTVLRINSSDIRPFIKIVTSATEGQVFIDGQAAMLAGDNMIDWKAQPSNGLRHHAIFASIPRTRSYGSIQCLFHH